MASIEYFTSFSPGNDNDYKLSVSQEQIARKMDVGSSWRHIRIGMRAMVSRSAAHLTSANFALGMTSGTSSLYSDSNTTHFVGFSMINSTFTYYSNFNDTYNASGSGNFYWKTGSLLQSASNSRLTCGIGTSEVTSTNLYLFRTMTFLDIIKSDTDPGVWTLKWYSMRNNVGATDISLTTFYTQLLNATQSVASPLSEYYLTEATLPVSESAHGYLDTVNIYWQNANTVNLFISDIAVYRFV